jgi:hypothetical protein
VLVLTPEQLNRRTPSWAQPREHCGSVWCAVCQAVGVPGYTGGGRGELCLKCDAIHNPEDYQEEPTSDSRD